LARITKIEGLEELKAGLKGRMDLVPVENLVKKHGAQLSSRTQENMRAAYVHGYSTGRTRRSVKPIFSDAGMTVSVGPTTNYFPYLEYGTRFMNAMPTLKPAFDVQSVMFINELKRLMQ
jgi:HK97 gp10 family phage protein